PTGQLDDATWKQLAGAGGDVSPLIDYTVTDADLAGPFTPDIPANLPDQASLDALNYRSALEALAERFHSSPALLQQLNPQAKFQTAGEKLSVPNIANTFSPAPPAATAPPAARGGRGTASQPAQPAARGRRATTSQAASPASDVTVYVTK